MTAEFSSLFMRRPDIARIIEIAGRPFDQDKLAAAWGRQYRRAMMDGARCRMLDSLPSYLVRSRGG